MSDNIDDQDDLTTALPPEEIDVQVGEPEPEKKPDVVTMSVADFAALKASSDSAQAIQKGIEGLSAKLGGQAQPTPTPVNTPTQSPEEFFAEHSDDLFDKEKGAKLMAEYTKKVTAREYGPLLTAQAAALVATRKELLESRDPTFKKYKSEVEALVKSQPQDVQLQPDIYERAWQSVRQTHAQEIENESVDAKVKAAVDAKLKELGIDPEKPNAGTRPPAYENSAARTAGGTANGKRTIRLPNKETEDKLRREAERRGLEFSDYLKIKGY